MNFQETLHYLEQLGEFRMRLDLAPFHALLERFEYESPSFPIVLVGGTNGKGSVCAFLTAITRASGISVGTFTSPHLVSPTERISINGQPISEMMFARLASNIVSTASKMEDPTLTYFECITLMALKAFQESSVKLAILEVGLGGRLDATNALPRIGTIITSIAYDHTHILGDTLEEIAQEKAAIMRNGVLCVVGYQLEAAKKTLMGVGMRVGADLLVQDVHFHIRGEARNFVFHSHQGSVGPLGLGLRGDHQVHNAGLATAMAFELSHHGFSCTQESISLGLQNATNPGRLELWKDINGREIWLDVAHNVDATDKVVQFFLQQQKTPLDLLVGILADKDWKSMMKNLLSISNVAVLCRPNSARAWNLQQAMKEFEASRKVTIIANVIQGLEFLLQRQNRILVTGSFYVVGVVLRFLRGNASCHTLIRAGGSDIGKRIA